MSQKTVTKQEQWQKLFNYILGDEAAWIATIGLKAELFRAIADAGAEGVTEEALAERLGYDQRYVQVWCRGAYAFEFLEWDEQGYRLAPHLQTLLLDPSDPQYMGGRIQFYTALYEDYRIYPDYLRSGEHWPRSAHDPFLLKALKNVTQTDCVMITEQILPQVPATLARLEEGGRILDIGAGGGYHAVHYATRFPQTEVIGLEIDEPSVALARQTVSDAGVDEQVEIQHGDAIQLRDEKTYDLITMNIALHETGGPTEYRTVLDRARRALRPNGAVVVSELPYPDSPRAYREDPIYQMYAGVQIHEAVVGCGMITKGQLRELLEGARFEKVRVAEHSAPTRFVMIGEKSGRG